MFKWLTGKQSEVEWTANAKKKKKNRTAELSTAGEACKAVFWITPAPEKRELQTTLVPRRQRGLHFARCVGRRRWTKYNDRNSAYVYWAVQAGLLTPGIAQVPWLLLLPVRTFLTMEGGDSEFANFTLLTLKTFWEARSQNVSGNKQ